MQVKPQGHSPIIGPGVIGSLVNVPEHGVGVVSQRPVAQMPLSGAAPFATDPSNVSSSDAGGRQHTQYPYVTGASVLAFHYADGVLMACDTLGAYGSTKRYKSVQRILEVNSRCIVGASGEISDFQQIQKYLEELTMDDFTADDGIELTPREVHAYLTRVMYNRRNKFDPLWNSLVVAGVEADGSPFSGMVSMIGVHYEDKCVCTGFASHLALPMLRERAGEAMGEAEAKQLMQDALRVCFYRDKDSINRFIMVTVTPQGVKFDEPIAVPTKWDFKVMQNPTRWTPGAW